MLKVDFINICWFFITKTDTKFSLFESITELKLPKHVIDFDLLKLLLFIWLEWVILGIFFWD